jgi:hypothetical protein
MRFLRHLSARLSQLIERVRTWKRRRVVSSRAPLLFVVPSYSAALHRDVTPQGVRFYSLCCDCGARLNLSATLCEDCAQKRTRSARQF